MSLNKPIIDRSLIEYKQPEIDNSIEEEDEKKQNNRAPVVNLRNEEYKAINDEHVALIESMNSLKSP